jgi:hypothetical protein
MKIVNCMTSWFRKNLKAIPLILIVISFLTACTPVQGPSEIPLQSDNGILWCGDFETGDFMQWHNLEGTHPNYSSIPQYGRPPVPDPNDWYGGDGSLLSLETNITRFGNYSAKFTVKNSQNGDMQEDSDNGVTTRRRTELNAIEVLPVVYNAVPYGAERWMSISYYVPSDWDDEGTDWGINVWQMKPLENCGLVSPAVAIAIQGGEWIILHRNYPYENPRMENIDWQYQMYYNSEYPGGNDPAAWPDGEKDWVDGATSRSHLASLNKGGWTDWVVHLRYDVRGEAAGGKGFINIWKREDNGPWVHILNILPMDDHVRGTGSSAVTWNRGIGYNVPTSSYGINCGMYMHLDQVWNLQNNRVLYIDNVRIGDENSSLFNLFEEQEDCLIE